MLISRFIIPQEEARSERVVIMAATINLFRNPDKAEYPVVDPQSPSFCPPGFKTFIVRRNAVALRLLILIMVTSGLALAQSPSTDQQSSSSTQTTINPKLPTVFVAGDSTANNHANGGLGWGDPFINYF